MRNFEIIVTVVDKTQRLEEVKNRIRSVRKETRSISQDITRFNRGLFAATAAAVTFSRAFIGLGRTVSEAADWERLTSQFDFVVGSSRKFLDTISRNTDVVIDKTEALRAGLSLANLGLAKNSESISNLIIKAGVAAKLAGKDSAEGIRDIAEFMKTGNIVFLQHLDLLHEANAAFKIQQSVLGKVGGAFGGVIALQHRLAVGQALLDARTRNYVRGLQDLKDVVGILSEEYRYHQKELGVLVGKALVPLAKNLTNLIISSRNLIQNLKDSKEIQFLVKALLSLAGAATATIGVFATLNGMVYALNSLGFGVPKLTATIIGLLSAFIGITAPIKSVEERLNVLGAVFRGIWELIQSYNSDTGLSKMAKTTYELLDKYRLLGFVQFLSRVGILIKQTVKDIVNVFKWVADTVDNIIGEVSQLIFKFLNLINTPWKNSILSDKIGFLGKTIRFLTVSLLGFFAIFAGRKAFGFLTPILAKIPILGKLFRDGPKGPLGGGGPKGTATDPVYVVSMDKILGSIKNIPGVGKVGEAAKKLKDILSSVGGKFKNLKGLLPLLFGSIVSYGKKIFTGIFGVSKNLFISIFSWSKNLFIKLSGLIGTLVRLPLAVIGKWLGGGLLAYLGGYKLGEIVDKHIINKFTQGTTEEGFEGNIIERSFFKLNKLLGTDLYKNYEAQQRQLKKYDLLGRPNKSLIEGSDVFKGVFKERTLEDVYNKVFPTSLRKSFTSTPVETELQSLDMMYSKLQQTPAEDRESLKHLYDKGFDFGLKPSQIVDRVVLKLDELKSELILTRMELSKNRTLMTNPMNITNR